MFSMFSQDWLEPLIKMAVVIGAIQGAVAYLVLAERRAAAFFQDRVYTTVIPRNIRLGEAPSHGVPAILYDVKSRGAEAYLALARELLARGDSTPAPAQETQHG